jgi:hypothetical protein
MVETAYNTFVVVGVTLFCLILAGGLLLFSASRITAPSRASKDLLGASKNDAPKHEQYLLEKSNAQSDTRRDRSVLDMMPHITFRRIAILVSLLLSVYLGVYIAQYATEWFAFEPVQSTSDVGNERGTNDTAQQKAITPLNTTSWPSLVTMYINPIWNYFSSEWNKLNPKFILAIPIMLFIWAVVRQKYQLAGVAALLFFGLMNFTEIVASSVKLNNLARGIVLRNEVASTVPQHMPSGGNCGAIRCVLATETWSAWIPFTHEGLKWRRANTSAVVLMQFDSAKGRVREWHNNRPGPRHNAQRVRVRIARGEQTMVYFGTPSSMHVAFGEPFSADQMKGSSEPRSSSNGTSRAYDEVDPEDDVWNTEREFRVPQFFPARRQPQNNFEWRQIATGQQTPYTSDRPRFRLVQHRHREWHKPHLRIHISN